MKLLVFFSFVLMAAVVAGQNTMSGCLDHVDEQIRRNPSSGCQYVEDSFKCMLRITGVANRADVEDAFELKESGFKNTLSHLGLNCTIDFNKLFDEVRKDNAAPTTSPKGWLVAMVTSFLVVFQQQL